MLSLVLCYNILSISVSIIHERNGGIMLKKKKNENSSDELEKLNKKLLNINKKNTVTINKMTERLSDQKEQKKLRKTIAKITGKKP